MFHVEIARNPTSNLKREALKTLVIDHIKDLDYTAVDFNFDLQDPSNSAELQKHCESIRIYKNHQFSQEPKGKLSNGHGHGHGHGVNGQENGNESQVPAESSLAKRAKKDEDLFQCHIFELNDGEDEAEYIDDDNEDENGSSPASHHYILPSRAMDGLWESLIFETELKSRLIEYVRSALLFSEKSVNSTLISWNKVILLHGPAGTGKTSLCKALAQKATILNGDKFTYGQLIEINSHSLFSKWFSESGKLIMKMFEKINELIEDPQALIFLLIDEVESLAKCRVAAVESNEPSDGIRAVNALLTQIDKIKRYPNVIILTTSNVVSSIDLAFVDRADLKVLIGKPPPSVTYEIYSSSLNELIRVGIITYDYDDGTAGTGDKRQLLLPRTYNVNDNGCHKELTQKLFAIAEKSQGLSGRTLRKIPFLAHMNFICRTKCSISEFLSAMDQVVQVELVSNEDLGLKK